MFTHSISQNLVWSRGQTQGFPSGSVVKNPHAVQETQVPSLGREDPLKEGMATHASILAWRIPQTQEPGRLQSMLQSWTQLSD